MKKFIVLLVLLMFVPCVYGKDRRLKSTILRGYFDNYYIEDIGCNISYDEDGRLFKIDYSNMTTSIDYTNIEDGYLTVNVNIPDERYDVNYIATLDDDGRVDIAERIEQSFGACTYFFEYAQNRLNSFIQYEDSGNIYTNLCFDAGNLIKFEYYNDLYPDEIDWREYEYSGDYNLHGIKLLESMWGVQLDGLEILAQAGFLGDPPAQFPSSWNDSDGNVVVGDYVFDEDGYLIQANDNNAPELFIYFYYEDVPDDGVEAIHNECDNSSQIYTLDGIAIREIANPGIYILVKNDGSFHKILKN
ncbi:MAG: DUF4595 domain-containing protein [Muribaculaceae bacterium]|nr:DUF4595 domain-containing protein [Muribaculaceae bacterium]